MLQLSLLLVDALHRQTLVILLGFGDGLVLKQVLQRHGVHMHVFVIWGGCSSLENVDVKGWKGMSDIAH